ncbi:MICOS complex subunit MIC60 [Mycena kentingensis (nom. inval.)]|nr:MICOS complex subunit MIC60 [Mycena kentingensis (nom. inval.)]
MYRTLPTTRNLVANRGVVRVVRRRLATEAAPAPPPPPKKKRHIVRTLFLTTTALGGAFYIGSTFYAFQNETYYDVFTEQVPLGYAMLEFAESRNWDKMTLASVVESSKKRVADAQKYVTDKINGTTPEPEVVKSAKKDVANAKKEAVNAREAAAKVIQDSKERANAAAARIKTTVKKNAEPVEAVVKHQIDQFSSGVAELIREAEAALAKPIEAILAVADPTAESTPSPTNASSVYDAPLPIGHELPPGYARPLPPKKPAPPPPSLPRLSPELSTITASEPIIAHLAGTIDSLTTYVEENPAAASKAASVVESAKEDLTALVTRITKVRESERAELEAKLEDQAKEYTGKLIELEMEAQDRLDGQEAEFRMYFEEHRAALTAAYREKLENELRTQTDLINERLKEEVIAQGIELQRRWIREVKVHVEQERGGRLAKIEEISANLKRLERVAVDNSIYLDENIRIHALWAALRALSSSALSSSIRKPFRDELRTVRHIAAAREDPVALTVLEALDKTDVPDVGVEPFADLATWFAREVAPKVAHVALVPDENAGVLAHLASRVFASLQFRRQGLVAGNDVMSVLARAEHYLNEKDLDSAARELNQLNGTAKLLLQDWLEAARRRLEVQQALEVVQTQATLASLLVV